jgi:2-(3-amino-3-carboxypropyl)histidine synthase
MEQPTTTKVRKFIGKKNVQTQKTTSSDGISTFKAERIGNSIPDSLLNDVHLADAIKILPDNYNFEIHKSIWRIQRSSSKKVALQFPEGLLAYSCIISDILERYTGAEMIIMGDVTYGACCVDDFTARALGCDFLVHYGHSCLVPLQNISIETLYVFVDIKIDTQHFVDTIIHNFKDKPLASMALVGTIQFSSSLHVAKRLLLPTFPNLFIPQSKPLSPGEIIGCTSPILKDCDTIIYLADGRFHLESIMISNPLVPAYQYDPFSKQLLRQYYEFDKMIEMRSKSIEVARHAKRVGIILGTLGRQGSPAVLKNIEGNLKKKGIQFVVVLLSEIFPDKLALFSEVDAWIQVACPRLSLDWGYAFSVPLLNPFEGEIAFGSHSWDQKSYSMDYYSKEGGYWSNYSEGKKEGCQTGECSTNDCQNNSCSSTNTSTT